MDSPSLHHVPALHARRPARLGAWRVQLNGLFLFGLILAYFGALIFAADRLVDGGFRVREWNPLPNAPVLSLIVRATLYTLLVLVLVRIVTTLFQVLSGLVTARYDQEAYANIDGVVLDRQENRQIYELVFAVGLRVGAPPPDVIYVTHHADCYALELREFGIRTRRCLILVLGLPHLEVLTVSELRIILAHELAHFRGDTRLAVFAFRFFESLQSATQTAPPAWRRCDPVFWFSRMYFHLFLVCSAPIRRRQELRADGWSASAYGGPLACQTLLKEWQIGAHFDSTVASFRPQFAAEAAERGENVFRRFRASWRDFSPAGYAYLRRRLAAEEKGSFWDSHPTIESRLATMDPFPNQEGPDARPAHDLLPNLAGLEEQLQQRIFADESLNCSLSPLS